MGGNDLSTLTSKLYFCTENEKKKLAKIRAKEEDGDRMTEEEATAVQRILFTEACAHMNNNGATMLTKKPRET